MDRIAKALQRLSMKEREKIKEILTAILARDRAHLNIQKLRGHDNIYRIRKGGIRVIYRTDQSSTEILAVERRSDTTYHRY